MRRFTCSFILVFILYHGCTCRGIKSTIPPSNYAIAVWAYPDGVSVPYRNDSNAVIAGNAYIGVVAYHATGIARVNFSVDGGSVTSVTGETSNPDTGEYEYVFELDPGTLSEGEHTISATAYPNEGDPRRLPDLKIQKDTATHDVISVPGDYATLHDACVAANSGDIIQVTVTNLYDLPDQAGYDFTKYVTIMSDGIATVSIRSGSLRSSYIKFKNVTFDLTYADNESIISSEYTHFWFDNCDVHGFGSTVASNNAAAFNFYNLSGYIVIESCTIDNSSFGANITTGNCIVRGNTVSDLTSDGFGYDGNNVLITGNTIHDNHLPAGGSQHCDFLQSNGGANQVVLRNNYCYNGDHQGVKFGGYNDGRDQPYTNIAVINNVFALGSAGSVNFRFEGTTKGKRFSNILVEYNTFWNGTSMFVIEPDLSASNVHVRNNIFGPDPVEDMSDYIDFVAIDNNCYNQSPATGDNSIVGDPSFTDESAWDFRLQIGSPCIDKADKSSGINYDLNFILRDSNSDVGAYEY